MAKTHVDVYTEGGAPSNGQVASVKVATVDLSKLADVVNGGTVGIADTINLFDIQANEQFINGGYEVITAMATSAAIDIGIDGGVEYVDGDVATADGPIVAAAGWAVGVTGTMTILTSVAASAVGVIKVWAVVANIDDPHTHTVIDTAAP